jgi:hypothetical protein
MSGMARVARSRSISHRRAATTHDGHRRTRTNRTLIPAIICLRCHAVTIAAGPRADIRKMGTFSALHEAGRSLRRAGGVRRARRHLERTYPARSWYGNLKGAIFTTKLIKVCYDEDTLWPDEPFERPSRHGRMRAGRTRVRRGSASRIGRAQREHPVSCPVQLASEAVCGRAGLSDGPGPRGTGVSVATAKHRHSKARSQSGSRLPSAGTAALAPALSGDVLILGP